VAIKARNVRSCLNFGPFGCGFRSNHGEAWTCHVLAHGGRMPLRTMPRLGGGSLEKRQSQAHDNSTTGTGF